MTQGKNEEYVNTDLVFASSFFMENEKKRYFYDQHLFLPKMKQNQLQLYGLDFIIKNQQVVVPAFIRSTVEEPIKLKASKIFLMTEDSEILAHTEVDFAELGVLKSNTATPWEFTFPKNELVSKFLQTEKPWYLSFEEKNKHFLDLSDMKEEAISEKSKQKLEKIVQQSALQPNEVALTGLSAVKNGAGDLAVTLLVQNGTEQDLELTQLPLKLYDARGELAAQGTFRFEHLTVLSNSSKPMQIVFPKKNLMKEDLDLTHWTLQHVD